MPLFRKFAILSISSTKNVGSRQGMVMYQIIFMRVAPSTLAASYNSASMPEIAAMYIIDDQPRFFHVSHSHCVSQTPGPD